MSTINLEQPITAGGVEWINFFNGRLLSGEDLTHEQKTTVLRDQRLGQTVGSGVVYGLEVATSDLSTVAAPAVKVLKGLAVNVDGLTLCLPDNTDIALTRQDDDAAETSDVFGECSPLQPGTYIAGEGVYLLTLAPAEATEGKAPVSGLGNIPASCNSRYIVSGVQFRLQRLFTSTELGDPTSLRNRAAYSCFGFPDANLNHFLNSPTDSKLDGYGKLDASPVVKPCEVPLALLCWTAKGVEWIDAWSVRRRVIHPAGTSDLAKPELAYFVGDRREAEAEAMFFQFQKHLDDLIKVGTAVNSLQAESLCKFLPPAGILPGATDWKKFLGSHAPSLSSPIDIEIGQARPLLRRALGQEPVEMSPASGSPIPFNVYRVRSDSNYFIFARSNLNETVASDVFFDNSQCQLDNADTVQEAIEELCKLARGCCTLVVRPETGWEKVFEKVKANENAQICFQPGTYNLSRPIVVKGKGHLELHGAGQATRIVSTVSEPALAFDSWASVAVSDLQVKCGGTARPEISKASDGQVFRGALSFVNCAEVMIDSIVVDSGGSKDDANSCLSVRNQQKSKKIPGGAIVTVQNSEFQVAENQIGIQVINAARAQIQNNLVRAPRSTNPNSKFTPGSQGIVVGGVMGSEVRILNNSVADVLQGIHLGLSHDGPHEEVDVAGKVWICGNSVKIVLAKSNDARHGFFVGNCQSLTLNDNRAEASTGTEQAGEGIRVYGVIGRFVSIQNNDLKGFTTGIKFQPTNEVIKNPKPLWIVSANLAQNAAKVFDYPSTLDLFIIKTNNLQ